MHVCKYQSFIFRNLTCPIDCTRIIASYSLPQPTGHGVGDNVLIGSWHMHRPVAICPGRGAFDRRHSAVYIAELGSDVSFQRCVYR